MRKRRRWLWLLVLAPLFVIAAGIWGYVALVHRVGRYVEIADTLPAEIVAAKREGLPLTPSDLRPNPPVPDSQNAAPLYRRVTGLINARPKADGDAFSDYLKGPRDQSATSRVKGLLGAWAEPLRLAERASARPACDFHRPWEQGPHVTFPEYAAMRAAVRALAVRAVIENSDGKPLQALDTVRAIAHISHHAATDSMVIAMLVEIALQAIGDRPFREVVCTHLDDPAVLAKADAVLRDFDPQADLTQSLRGEVVIGRVAVDIVRNERSGFERVVGFKPPKGGIRREMTDAWDANMLRHWRSMFAVLRETEDNGLARRQRLMELDSELMKHDREPGYELSVVLMPVFSQAQDKVLGGIARQNLRRGLLRIADFHRKRKRFPSVSEAAPLLPKDPFANAVLKYKPATDGFKLYSIGENLRDDGGNDWPAKKGAPAPDLVIRFPYSAAPAQ